MPASSRLASLDGLRGLAALVVVVHHAVLTLPSLANQLLWPDAGAPAWWLTYTPAYLAWAGPEAVLVFFVLSGLVLALPWLGPGRSGGWAPYYRKRLVRLYVPVVAAVLLTGVIVTLVPRAPGAGWSWWMLAHTGPVDISGLARDAVLLTGTGWANSALWSLKYEVLFSLLLPVFVLAARRVALPLGLALPVTLAGVGGAAAAGFDAASYLGVFAVGVLLAQHRDTVARWAGRMGVAGPGAWIGWLLIALGLLLGQVWLRLGAGDPRLELLIGRPGAVLGAALLVVCCLHAPALRTVMCARPLQWLGAISFGLYLVHEPIVVSVATVAGPTKLGVLGTLGVGTALSLGAAVLFHRLVERPSCRLAGRVAVLDRVRIAERVSGWAPVTPALAGRPGLLGLRGLAVLSGAGVSAGMDRFVRGPSAGRLGAVHVAVLRREPAMLADMVGDRCLTAAG